MRPYRPDQRLFRQPGGHRKKLIEAGGRATLLHQILERVGLEAFALAAGFQSMEALMGSHGAAAFVRASMRVVLEQERQEREGN